jgi:hypothetical protein
MKTIEFKHWLVEIEKTLGGEIANAVQAAAKRPTGSAKDAVSTVIDRAKKPGTGPTSIQPDPTAPPDPAKAAALAAAQDALQGRTGKVGMKKK